MGKNNEGGWANFEKGLDTYKQEMLRSDWWHGVTPEKPYLSKSQKRRMRKKQKDAEKAKENKENVANKLPNKPKSDQTPQKQPVNSAGKIQAQTEQKNLKPVESQKQNQKSATVPQNTVKDTKPSIPKGQDKQHQQQPTPAQPKDEQKGHMQKGTPQKPHPTETNQVKKVEPPKSPQQINAKPENKGQPEPQLQKQDPKLPTNVTPKEANITKPASQEKIQIGQQAQPKQNKTVETTQPKDKIVDQQAQSKDNKIIDHKSQPSQDKPQIDKTAEASQKNDKIAISKPKEPQTNQKVVSAVSHDPKNLAMKTDNKKIEHKTSPSQIINAENKVEIKMEQHMKSPIKDTPKSPNQRKEKAKTPEKSVQEIKIESPKEKNNDLVKPISSLPQEKLKEVQQPGSPKQARKAQKCKTPEPTSKQPDKMPQQVESIKDNQSKNEKQQQVPLTKPQLDLTIKFEEIKKNETEQIKIKKDVTSEQQKPQQNLKLNEQEKISTPQVVVDSTKDKSDIANVDLHKDKMKGKRSRKHSKRESESEKEPTQTHLAKDQVKLLPGTKLPEQISKSAAKNDNAGENKNKMSDPIPIAMNFSKIVQGSPSSPQQMEGSIKNQQTLIGSPSNLTVGSPKSPGHPNTKVGSPNINKGSPKGIQSNLMLGKVAQSDVPLPTIPAGSPSTQISQPGVDLLEKKLGTPPPKIPPIGSPKSPKQKKMMEPPKKPEPSLFSQEKQILNQPGMQQRNLMQQMPPLNTNFDAMLNQMQGPSNPFAMAQPMAPGLNPNFNQQAPHLAQPSKTSAPPKQAENEDVNVPLLFDF